MSWIHFGICLEKLLDGNPELTLSSIFASYVLSVNGFSFVFLSLDWLCNSVKYIESVYRFDTKITLARKMSPWPIFTGINTHTKYHQFDLISWGKVPV